MTHRIALIALAVVVALAPSLALANCEPPEGGNRIGIKEDSTTHVNEPAPGGGVGGQGGLAGTPAAPGGTPAGGANSPAAGSENTNKGGTVTSTSKETPTVTGTKDPSSTPGNEIFTNGGTTVTANPGTTIAGGVTTSGGGQGVEGGTTRGATGTIKIDGATITVKKDPATGDTTIVAVGGTQKFTGGSNLDGSPVPVGANGAPANAVIFKPFEDRPSVTSTYTVPATGQ